MYEITKACSRGDLKDCSCNKKLEYVNRREPNENSDDKSRFDANQNMGKYEWGGCSDNVLFGHRLSKYFVDSKEIKPTTDMRSRPSRRDIIDTQSKLMNLHNNEVGRRVSIKSTTLSLGCSLSMP